MYYLSRNEYNPSKGEGVEERFKTETRKLGDALQIDIRRFQTTPVDIDFKPTNFETAHTKVVVAEETKAQNTKQRQLWNNEEIIRHAAHVGLVGGDHFKGSRVFQNAYLGLNVNGTSGAVSEVFSR